MCCFEPLCEIIAGVPRLFDLVSVSDPKLRLAFWYALRHTLVADNLDQASRIAYGTRDKRFSRVVTMAGQLITGARWGGGWCASAVLALFVSCFLESCSVHRTYTPSAVPPHMCASTVFCSASHARCLLLLLAESGTMSGGGGKPRGGRMKLGNAAPRAAAAADGKAAAKELAATEAQLAEVEGQLRQTRNERYGQGHGWGQSGIQQLRAYTCAPPISAY